MTTPYPVAAPGWPPAARETSRRTRSGQDDPGARRGQRAEQRDTWRQDAGPGLGGPVISLPKGGGAIRGIGEKFTPRPVTGTGTAAVPIPVSAGRSGFQPDLALAYDSGAGNGPFGLGWQLTLPAITLRTDRGLPRYRDGDVYLISGEDDLVPVLSGGRPVEDVSSAPGYTITRFRPRTEGSFARIERWIRMSDGDVHWRTLSAGNVLSLYGRDAGSRITDPDEPGRVFSWLLCEVRDDRGNAIVYRYKAENAAGVDVSRPHERGRGPADSPARTANRYLKAVRYGNQVPLLDDAGRRPTDVAPDVLREAGWMFEVVFDYGEHDRDEPRPGESGAWMCRNDPFSSYRAGFEVRTYRLCQRILMFHHFPEEPGVGMDCLVSATEFGYRSSRVMSFLDNVTQRGYQRAESGGYTHRELPPVRFEYSQAVIDPTVRELDPDSVANLPAGIDGRAYTWVDLNGEGLSGVLTGQDGGLYYQSNLGGGRLGPAQLVATRPSLTDLADRHQQLADLDGDGRIELVQLGAEPAGFFSRTADGGWASFVPFALLPSIDWDSPDLLMLDLTGDGRTDLLLCEDNVFTWYPSLAKAGFGPPNQVPQPYDEERGPRLLLSDDRQSIFLADMSGDGLTDLVRVRDGEICYWPNLGYGRFGANVVMDDSPRFEQPDRFDPSRLRLADIDGSGTSDVVYLGSDGIRLWSNESGNGWTAAHHLAAVPHLDNSTSVQIADLLGNGTACLVWSSPLPGDAPRTVRYVDLMGGVKPNLLVRLVNNQGGETTIRYAASTMFYLADRRAGRPWKTQLPFPVHVVASVEHIDHVSRIRLASSYSYHNGFYDGVEREFNGFAMIEQIDAESFADHVAGVEAIGGHQDTTADSFQPPVTTRTWYHTGAGTGLSLHSLREEYYLGQPVLPELAVPAGLEPGELRECFRAWRGLPLRQEVYSLDGSARQNYPYGVVEYGYDAELIQHRSECHPAVFLPRERETITLSYEREPSHPRVTHQLNLRVGPYGNVLAAAAVTYGRALADPSLPPEVTQDQQQTHVTYGEQDYTPDLDQTAPVAAYRLRTPYQSRGYELTGITPATAWFTRAELIAATAAAEEISYEVIASGSNPQKRLLSRSVVVFRDDALNRLPVGQWDTLGLSYEYYQLAFTPGVVAAEYAGAVTDTDLANAGYVHLDGDLNWWLPSGISLYPADPAAHFYLPAGHRDPLGLQMTVTRDRYQLLTEAVRVNQAAWSTTTATNDYRVLGPVLVTDPNQRRRAVQIDELGMVVRSAVMGRVGTSEGDTLADPTERFEYDVSNWLTAGRPNFAHTFARETSAPGNTRWLESYVYANGSGGVAMVKGRVHPGRALQAGTDGTTTEVDADPRWVGNGRTILNNKGSPVKQYEPYFSTTHEYEDENVLRRIGAPTVQYYDALGRAILTRYPNGTLSRIEFTAWRQTVFDVNDTVLESQWYADRGSPNPAGPEPTGDPQRRSAWLTAKHANTPGVIHLDSLGRAVYAVADYGGGKTAEVRAHSDLTGRLTEGYDQLRRQISTGFNAMNGVPIWAWSAEKGKRWMFQDALGAVLRVWDEHGRQFRNGYDSLHRPVARYARDGAGPEKCLEYVVFGDRNPAAGALGLYGLTELVFDQTGLVRIPEVDFLGRPVQAERILASDYAEGPDWSSVAAADYTAMMGAAGPLLETGEVFTSKAQYDALNRPVSVTLPDTTVLLPTYEEGGMLGRLQLQVRGQGPFTDVLQDQDYDAKGQRQFARYGNGLTTRYFYDPATFRLDRLLTSPAESGAQVASLQDLRYTYDPCGNVTDVGEPQLAKFFRNSAVASGSSYEYDALYQLIKASGRELAGGGNDTIRDYRDIGAMPQLPSLSDANAIRNYAEEYEYDVLGNITVLRHRFKTQSGVGAGWTRHYRYAYQDNPADLTNRLTATSGPGDPETGPYSSTYRYDVYGNMLTMPHLSSLGWNVMDQLRQVDLGGGGEVHYVYGAGGERTRKVIDRHGSLQLDWIYLGAVTIFRRRDRVANTVLLERWTLRIADDTGPFVQVDTKTADTGNTDPANPLDTPLIRYQFTDHLGSAVLEADSAGNVISYEEYHPYGTSAYRYGKPGIDLSLKRYRFTGHECDEETGLYYFGARYYAPWLGRWTSTDPGGFTDSGNLFRYSRNNPVSLIDPVGLKTLHKVDVEIRQPNFTGWESHTVEDFRGYMAAQGQKLDPHVTAGNAHIWFEPNRTYDAESHSYVMAPGGTWHLHAEFETSAKPAAPAQQAPVTSGTGGAAASVAGPSAEKFIWNYPFKGIEGGYRGNILEWLYGVPWRSNTKSWDLNEPTEVKQVRSTSAYKTVGTTTRGAMSDAADAIAANPGTMAGKQPKAVIITPTDAPSSVSADISTANVPGGGRKITPGAAPPEHVRGLPGRVGMLGRAATVAGFALSAWAVWGDYQRGDWQMGTGDAFSAVGGGLETYALTSFGAGAAIGGVSVMTIGLALGGIGIAVASGVSMTRAIKAGDTGGAIAGGVGIAAGTLITAGAVGLAAVSLGLIAAAPLAPVLIAVGVGLAIGVGLYHLYKWWSKP
jgi:RHS repeat-associated protein